MKYKLFRTPSPLSLRVLEQTSYAVGSRDTSLRRAEEARKLLKSMEYN